MLASQGPLPALTPGLASFANSHGLRDLVGSSDWVFAPRLLGLAGPWDEWVGV